MLAYIPAPWILWVISYCPIRNLIFPTEACGQAGDADLAERMARRLLRNRLTPDVARRDVLCFPEKMAVLNGKTIGKHRKNMENGCFSWKMVEKTNIDQP